MVTVPKVIHKSSSYVLYANLKFVTNSFGQGLCLIFPILTIVVRVLRLRLLIRVVGGLRVRVEGGGRAPVGRLGRAVARVAGAARASAIHNNTSLILFFKQRSQMDYKALRF